ncbi:MAG: secondary thiamine-phosphate synthase enzyme YjbQ [Candidatus Krumholzibacteria bacterium]|nr:secondary thiamine-phosphate synthase enzyme YjbQ [Candidatus Krumholzibacteria bacterium]
MLKRELSTSSRTDFVDATGLVQAAVRELEMDDGVVVVFNPHTTAAVTINEGADPDVVRDMSVALDRIVPWQDGYHHAEGNAAAHIKASMFGSSVTVIVQDGRLQLGTWQKIWFCEFDGPRRRRLWIRPLSTTA